MACRLIGVVRLGSRFRFRPLLFRPCDVDRALRCDRMRVSTMDLAEGKSRHRAREPIFRARLLAWYDAHARKLPWRENRDPYRVWLSEIMLQQTRVAAVIAHYHEFLRRFPTVEKLAAAREASVLAAWSGLGYYRRARMLHAAAKAIVRELGRRFPATAVGWQALPGIGRYTAAAIASIASGEAIAVVDGNVERVLHRVSGQRLKGEELWRLAEELLDRERPGDFNQAMMELGATVCTPRAPACLTCPVLKLCATQGEMKTAAKAPRQKKKEIHYALDCRSNGCRDGEVFLVQRPREARLMAGMWELPEIAAGAKAQSLGADEVAALKRCATQKQVPPPRLRSGLAYRLGKTARNDKSDKPLFTLTHSITVTDYTVRVWRQRALQDGRGKWVAAERLGRIPLTGLTRKILRGAGII
jgi:A/G-specific adenine glycosylase